MGKNWHFHPGVRSTKGEGLSLGERAADVMRNGMGSWAFVFGALLFLAVWMLFNGSHGFDQYPFILLNLCLSCLAALQGAILLIAAKRADKISSELAEHDYKTDQESRDTILAVHSLLKTMMTEHAVVVRKLEELQAQLSPTTQQDEQQNASVNS